MLTFHALVNSPPALTARSALGSPAAPRPPWPTARARCSPRVASVPLIVIDAPPGSGPKLHTHPNEEVFVVQEGSVTFTAGDDVIEASGGQVVVVPAGVPHRFVNSGAGRLGQVDIHASERFITQWLED
jgi:mannose-6-phosphate isomerase-like protein (cupin superfamily)